MRAWGLAVSAALFGCALELPRLGPAAGDREEEADFRGAVERVEAGEFAAARPVLEKLLERGGVLEDYYLYYLALARAHTGDHSGAVAALEQLRERHPRSVWNAAAALELGRLRARAGRLKEAEALLREAENSAKSAATRAAARLERAQVAICGGAAAAAAAELLELRRAGPPDAIAADARKTLQALRALYPELAPTAQDWLEEAKLLLREREYLLAEKALRAADPQLEKAEVLWLLAEAQRGQGLPAAAASTLTAFLQQHPTHPQAPVALFQLAKLFWNRDEEVLAEAAFRQFLRRYPDHPLAAEALYALGRIEQGSGRPAAAIFTYGELARRFPHAKTAPEARWRIGWIHYRNGRYGEAARAFAALAADPSAGPDAIGGRYWQARALEKLRRRAEARALYRRILREAPSSYYAALAEAKVGAGGGGSVPPPLPSVSLHPRDIDAYHGERFEALRALALPRLAAGELLAMEAAAADPDRAAALARAAADVDAYPLARRLVERLPQGDPRAEALREYLRYPLGFWQTGKGEAERQGVDPLLVVALIRQESYFDPEAVSPANAQGLMQLLPATARSEAAALGWPDAKAGRLDDPKVNMALGIRHLSALLRRWEGDLIKALAAYNGGAAAVEKWQARYGHLEPDEFVESLTYRETRDYVKRVLANYRAYARRYPEYARPQAIATALMARRHR